MKENGNGGRYTQHTLKPMWLASLNNEMRIVTNTFVNEHMIPEGSMQKDIVIEPGTKIILIIKTMIAKKWLKIIFMMMKLVTLKL